MRSAEAFGSVLQVTPVWLRPCAMGLVALVHAAVLFGVPLQKPDDLSVPVTLQIDVVAGGKPASGEQAIDEKQSDGQVGEVKPIETPPAEVKTVEVAEAKPVEAPPQPAENSPSPPEAKPIVPAEQALAMATPMIKPEQLHPDARDIQRQEKRKEQAKKPKEQDERTKRDPAAAPARVASRAGTDTGRGETGAASGGIAAADYSSLVNAEIRRHSHYPESASPATGTVVLGFTIGAAGRVTSSSVVQSSGHGALDSAARQTLSALSLPPPPGGRFSKTVPFHFRPPLE